MVPGLTIACTCHQAKDALCCQTTAGGTIAQKISTGEGAGVSTHWIRICDQICPMTIPGIQVLSRQTAVISHAFLTASSGAICKQVWFVSAQMVQVCSRTFWYVLQYTSLDASQVRFQPKPIRGFCSKSTSSVEKTILCVSPDYWPSLLCMLSH